MSLLVLVYSKLHISSGVIVLRKFVSLVQVLRRLPEKTVTIRIQTSLALLEETAPRAYLQGRDQNDVLHNVRRANAELLARIEERKKTRPLRPRLASLGSGVTYGFRAIGSSSTMRPA